MAGETVTPKFISFSTYQRIPVDNISYYEPSFSKEAEFPFRIIIYLKQSLQNPSVGWKKKKPRDDFLAFLDKTLGTASSGR